MNLAMISSIFDLIPAAVFGHPVQVFQEGTAHAGWPNCLRSADGFHTRARISSLRRSLPRRLQGLDFFLLEPISLHGFCATDRARESARYRNRLAGLGSKLYH